MSAPFRLDGWTFSSSAFDVLGDAAGYNAHEARGRWARAGSEATERQSYVFTEAAVRGLFGPSGVEALLAAELAERTDEGVRMLRMDGAIEWFADITSKRRRAGQARAKGAARDELGRMRSSSTPTTSPARAGVLDQHSPALPSSPVPDPVPDLPEQGAALDLKPPGRERSRRKPATPLPPDWKPRDEDNKLSGAQLEHELVQFKLHAKAKDRRQADWSAAWVMWQHKAAEFAPNSRRPAIARERSYAPPSTNFPDEPAIAFGGATR